MDYRIHEQLRDGLPAFFSAVGSGSLSSLTSLAGDVDAMDLMHAHSHLWRIVEMDGLHVQILALEEPDRVYFLLYDHEGKEIGDLTAPGGLPYGMDCFFNKAPDRDAYLAHFSPPFTHDAFLDWLEEVFTASASPFDFSKTRFE